MLLDEYVDFRVRMGESERLRAEREQAQSVREHKRWLRSVLRGRDVPSKGAAAPAPVAAKQDDAGDAGAAPAAPPAPQSEATVERELAHAGR
ncbi:hypothetical protein [Leifsonia sp. RAF41]|uniref:hypothetical protein n=1 Tax=Leifsonia sp. RAF41 TaxID=3233056 RepID=UPI003F967EE7